jgi:glycine betaine/choline ABC-type transport system substrate-binding protein/ABC-type proline/glycine betaine transport system permease subunit
MIGGRIFSVLIMAPVLATLLLQASRASSEEAINIASKTFPESYILAEIAAQLLTSQGVKVQRQLGLGGTLIAFEALKADSIDIYPEYTGTLSQAVLQRPDLDAAQLRDALASEGLVQAVSFGFNNSYAIALHEDIAAGRNITRISQLAEHPDLNLGFSLEFLNRADGWPALQAAYQLPHRPGGIEHALAYRAVATGKLDATDAYTTDGELDNYALRLLHDDKGFFPQYDAILLARMALPSSVTEILASLDGAIDEATMRSLNRRLANSQLQPRDVAAEFLRDSGLANPDRVIPPSTIARVLGYTGIHLKLTFTALLLACLVAIPAALILARHDRVARGLLYVTGLIQTIPALALLALLIPLVGLGQTPAIIALFLYSLLPIVRNTLTGIFGVDPLLKEVATGMGLTPNQQLWKVELPLAAPTILAGIKTAAIISIGTATLAAFVGAGGLGEPIITGLTLNDHRLILEGAIPAALLAVVVELLFEGIERITVPAQLRSR